MVQELSVRPVISLKRPTIGSSRPLLESNNRHAIPKRYDSCLNSPSHGIFSSLSRRFHGEWRRGRRHQLVETRKRTWSSRFHGWLPLLISSHEVDGVRKEKERLTTDHQGLVVAFLSFFFATLRLGCQGERASLKVKTTSTTGRRKGAQGLTVWPLHRLVKPVTSLSSRMKSLGYETTWRCHQNPFIGALGIQEPVIPGEPLFKG